MAKVHVVMNGLVLGVYESAVIAEAHARTVTGARVEEHEVRTRLPVTVSDDAASDDWDELPTPIEEASVETKPETPRALARAKAKKWPPDGGR